MIQQLEGLSDQSVREMLLMQTYKIAVIKSQVEALTDVLVKEGLVTREKLWKLVNKQFNE